MDSLSRQDHTPDPHQSHEHTNNQGSINPSTYAQFQTQSSAPSNDEFSTFFNVPGDDGPSQSFNQPWDSTSIIDPRLQQHGFAQHSNTWNQSPLHSAGQMGNQGQGLNSGDYPNAFNQPPNPYYAGYHHAQYPPFQGSSFNPSMSYGPGSLLSPHGYAGVNAPTFGNQTLSGQTISPSALQSYPSPYGQQDRQNFNHSPALAARSTSGSHVSPSGLTPRRKLYDENLANIVASGLPNGTVNGNVLIKDSKALSESTESERLGGFVFLGKETLDSDDPKGVLPKITPRKSLKEMKRILLKTQGDVPFDAKIRPALKKLKLSSRAQKVQSTVSSITTKAASPSSDEESSSSEEDSDDGSGYNEGGDAEPSPLPPQRPKDPVKAMEYDVIKVMWYKWKAQLTGSMIRGALGSFWDLVKPVRDAWKAEYNSITEAEAKNDKVKVEQHKSNANRHRKILESAIQATAQHGHPDLVSRLAENANLFLSFYQLLVDRFKESDFNGSTVTSILNVMVRCTSMNQALLEKTKLDKVLPRFVKRGNEATQKLVQSVNKIVSSNAGAEKAGVQTKSAKAESKPTSKSTSSSDAANGVKRSREPEAGSTKKSIATPQSKDGIAINGKAISSDKKKIPPTKQGAVKTEPKAVSLSPNPIALAQKTKNVVPKPTSLLTGLQSASKKPGTSMASQKAILTGRGEPVNVPEVKKVAPVAAVPKASFSFIDTLANLDKPKEVESTKKTAEDRPPETEEERKKRLRKESRRHLRVKWRPDANLVETRLFRHDPEEEIGHDSSLIRDATDVKNEGQMLKLHKDLEIDDEEEANDGTEFVPWRPLMAVDFDCLGESDKASNFERYGGTREPHSPERIVQQQRELTTLIAFYPTTLDIPHSPREPADPYSGAYAAETPFGTGSDKDWNKFKRREDAFFASRASSQYQPSYQAASSGSTTDINTLLKILGGQPQSSAQVQSQPMAQMMSQPAPSQAPQSSVLESIFAKFQTPQQQAITPQATPGQASQVDPSLQSVIEMFKQQQQPQYQPTPVYQPSAPAPQQTPDLSTLLAQFSQQSSNTQQTGYSYQSNFANENERKRPYDHGGNQGAEQYGESNKRNKAKKVRLHNGLSDLGANAQ